MPRVLLSLIVLLSGCASGARPESMAIGSSTVNIPPAYEATFAVASVGGGEETNPLWTSEVSGEAFKAALIQSLSNLGLYDPLSDNRVVAVLEALDQPIFGFSLTVTSTVNYRVINRSDEVVFEQRVVAPYTAAFSDSLYAVERLRLANEGSIRANIEAFAKSLVMSYTPSRLPDVSLVCCITLD